MFIKNAWVKLTKCYLQNFYDHACLHCNKSCVFGRVTITFNVNNSIPPQLEEDPEHTQKSQEDEVH